MPRGGVHPVETPDLGEFLDFGAGSEVVHSERWPVLRRRAWIAGCDDFSFPILCGRHGVFETPDGVPSSSMNRVVVRTELRVKRSENMLSAFAHESCKAILFRSQDQARRAATWLRALRKDREQDLFLAKTHVIYSTPRPLARAVVEKKWRDATEDRCVVFCGRDFEMKRGEVGLRVFARLVSEYPRLRCVYIGRVPPSVAAEYAALEPRLTIHQDLTRAESMRWFRRGHVLFHPSLGESPGNVFLEAAAAGWPW